MPHSTTKHLKGLDPRSPLVFDTRDLGPGTARTLTRTAAAPGQLGVELARIPAGAELELEVQLEGVSEGVLVTATVTAPLAGECARCLEAFDSTVTVRFQELFVTPGEATEAAEDDSLDSYRLDASGLLDLEPALRDAVVLELPLSPLCAEDCAGLCPECGVRLADAEPGHGHEQRGALWDALKDFRASQPAGGPHGKEGPDPGVGPAMTTHRTDAAPGRTKE
ncbi:MAG TPA: YceD family protein [Streptosporangiaceae bacterium]|jgi:uncharacterized protein